MAGYLFMQLRKDSRNIQKLEKGNKFTGKQYGFRFSFAYVLCSPDQS